MQSFTLKEYYGTFNGTLKVTQHDDNSLTGGWSRTDDYSVESHTLGSGSKISGSDVLLEWEGSSYKFTGKVTADGKSMSGTVKSTNYTGTWTAKQL